MRFKKLLNWLMNCFIVKYMRIKVLAETGLLLLFEKCIWIFQNGG